MKSSSPLAASTQSSASTPSTTPAATQRAIPQAMGRGSHSSQSNSGSMRRLQVGPGLSVSGAITDCDVLVVEGTVDAKLAGGKLIEISESGQFKGSVDIENADIAGRYEGDLTVHGRLTVRSTARISGIVKYGELEVNPGGQIIGEMQVVGSANAAAGNFTAQAPSFKSAAKFTALVDEEDGLPLESTRKVANG